MLSQRLLISLLHVSRLQTSACGITKPIGHDTAGLYVCRRTLFIQTEDTPNPDSVKFFPGEPVTGVAGKTYDFRSAKAASISPFARGLLRIPGIKGVFFGEDFISISKDTEREWSQMKPLIFHEIIDHYASKAPLVVPGADEIIEKQRADDDGAGQELNVSDSEIVLMIKELLDTRIRPSIQEDGGDVEFIKYEEGIVYLQLQGACTGCPSSSVTLKSGIERTIMYWIPEVQGCVQVENEHGTLDDQLAGVSSKQYDELEQRLQEAEKKQQD